MSSGAAIFGGSGSGNSGTYSTGALTFSASGSLLKVYSTGSAGSCSNVTAASITASSGLTVTFVDSVPAGTYNVLTSIGSKTISGTVTVNPPAGRSVASNGVVGNNYQIVLN